MLAIAVRYLTGRVVATHPSSREIAEWPPHPGRLFMALVAAWGETGRSPEGERALRVMEGLGAPALRVPACTRPEPLTCFVPVNSRSWFGAKTGIRRRTGRHFPAVLPDGDIVHVIWPNADLDPRVAEALAALCGSVTYLGHSSTLVHVYLDPSPPEPNLVPVEHRATERLRVAPPGRLDRLELDFSSGPARRRPDAGAWQGYAPPAPAADSRDVVAGDLAGDFLVLRRESGSGLALVSVLRLTEAMRGSVLAAANDPPLEALSGHGPGGGPSRRPHVAYVPLPDVGHPHADGHLLGLAAILPAGLQDGEREVCIRALALAADRPLTLGRLGAWTLASEPPGAAVRRGLQPATWLRPSRRWASVTPVVLDRFPKKEGDAEATVALACERAGLPRPSEVISVPVSPVLGVPAARDFPPFPGVRSGSRRWHTHAILVFDEPVAGPVLLGAGRFRGYGLFRPLTAEVAP